MGIGAAVGSFIGFLGSGTAAAGIALAAIRIGAAVAISAALTKKPGTPGIGARTLTSRGTLDAQQLIYGQPLVAGSLAYRNAHGPRNADLWAVHCLAGHECDSITDVWLDNRVIPGGNINGGAAGGGGVTTGTFGPTRGSVNTVEVWKHLGTDTQAADTNLIAASDDWTSSHRLRGICNAATKFRLNDRTEEVWEAGDPANVKFLVRGKIIYDPRLDTSPGANPDNASYFAWSDNPALCLADYLRDDKFSPFPGGIDASRIDWDAVEAAADDCDTLVAIPTASTEKRFTFNGVLYGTAAPEENVEALKSSMNGELIFTGGMYVIRAGVYESPTDTLDEGDITGPISVASALASDKRVNTMKAIYIDKDKLYEPTETPPISISAYKTTRDGGDELPESIELPGVDSWYQAQRIIQKRLHAANEELTIVVPCNLRAARFVPGERINVVVTERGWSPKVFKVLDWELYDRGADQIGVNLTLQEDDSAAYADPAEGDYSTFSSGGTLTIADPIPVPSVDSVPRGIRYGEGTWSINISANEDASGGADDGSVRFTNGRFVLPDGTIRPMTADSRIETSFDGSTTPPDGRFYMISGATNSVTRFGGNFGGTPAEDMGLFTAIYDRFNEQWYAVDLSGTETAFTPLDTDYVVATGTKTSASGGIDSLTGLVSYQELPVLTNGMPTLFSDFEGIDISRMKGANTSDFSMSTAQAFNGSRSLFVDYALSDAGLRAIDLSYGASYNVPIASSPRLIVPMRIYPQSSQAASADASYYLRVYYAGTITPYVDSQTITGDELTEDAWNDVQFEIDYSGVGSQYRNVYIQLRTTNAAGSGDHQAYFDATQMIDATDLPEFQGGVF